MAVLSSAATSLFNSGSSSGASGWLASTWTDIQNSDAAGSAGIMGALQNSASGDTSSFFTDAANNFATIAQTSQTSSSTFYAQLAAQNDKARQQAALDKLQKALADQQTQVQAKNVLDPNIYFQDGSYLDTDNNILTMSDGTQFDTTTGLKYVDPQNVIQLGNGSYLDTKNNVMTMSDGTQIDTVTGLKLSTTA